jgi:SRSO17 transposase
MWYGPEYRERWDKCGIPGELAFMTKPQLALEMLVEAVASGLFPAKWVGMDSAFGCNKEFLDAIPEGLYYFADVPSNTLVFAEMPEVKVPEYSGRGRRDLKPKASTEPVSVSSLALDEGREWSRVCLGEGAKGPIMADELALRVVDCRDGLPSQELWLYIRRLSDGSFKFSLCNAPFETALETLRSLAIRRWPIEQCFEECKSFLGMDHCEGRSWKSWHRHMLFVFIAHLFLLELRLSLKKTVKSS